MKRLLLVMGVLLLAATGLRAANDRAGVTSLFSLGGGGRALGMGGANVALSSDASGIFWNAATLTALPERSISFMHLSLPEGSYYDFAAFGWPTVDYGSFAAAGFLITTDEIQRRDNNGKLLGEFSANQQMYMLGYGKSITSYLAAGVSVKLFGHNIGDYSAFGAGADLGLMIHPLENVRIGFNAQNVITPKLTLDSEEEALPINYKAGIGVSFPLSNGRYQTSFEIDVDKTEKLDPVLHVGGELSILGSYFLRGGYDVDQVSVGAGIKYRMVTVGYNYRSEEYFDAQHRLSLDIALGGSVESILAKRRQQQQEAAAQLAREQREHDLRESMTQARYFFQNGIYDSAEVYYEKVSALSSGRDDESTQRLEEIESHKSEELSQTVRANVLAEVDSLEAEELFGQADLALSQKDMKLTDWFLGRLRPSYADDPRFQSLEAEYGSQVTAEIRRIQSEANKLLDKNDFTAAAILYDQALELNPDDPNTKAQLSKLRGRLDALRLLRDGVAAAEGGDKTSAKESLERVLEITPDDTVAQELHRRISNEPDAVPPSSLSDIQTNETIWKLYLDGIEKFRIGNYQQAINLWNEVLSVYPGNEETKKNIEQAKLRLQSSAASGEQ